MRSVFCQGCRSWQSVDGHLCPAEDGDQVVTVPLAALRAVVNRARSDDHWRPDYGRPEEWPELQPLIDNLGVEGL